MATGLLWLPARARFWADLDERRAARRERRDHRSVAGLCAGRGDVLGLALLAGSRVLQGLRSYLGADAWVRRLIGAAVLLGVVAIARGWDRGTLTRLSRLHTDSTEQTLIRLLRPERLAAETTAPTPRQDPCRS